VEGSGLEQDYGGAMVEAWMQAQSVKDAKSIFVTEMQKAGWQAEQFEDGFEVLADSYEPGDEEWQYVDQAKEEEAVYCIHAWSKDDPRAQH
jgi:hypothetical protein